MPDPAATAAAYAATVGIAVPPGPGAVPGEREVRIGDHGIRLVPPADGPAGARAASEPRARVAISATAGGRALRDLFGMRLARL